MLILGYTDRSTVTRFGAEAEVDDFFMLFSYRLHVVCSFSVPNTGKRVILRCISGHAWEAG